MASWFFPTILWPKDEGGPATVAMIKDDLSAKEWLYPLAQSLLLSTHNEFECEHSRTSSYNWKYVRDKSRNILSINYCFSFPKNGNNFSKKFLIEHLPSDQVTSPQKAHELAVRFENHVASSTETKVITI